MRYLGNRWLVLLLLLGFCLPGTAQYFRQVGSYSDGMAVVQEYRPNVGRMSNYGYINEYGKLVIPMKYGYAGNFNKGLAIVGAGIKRGLINKSGKVVLPILYDAIDFLPSSQSEAVVKVTKDGKEGVAGKNGIILPCRYIGIYGGYVEGDRRSIIFAEIDLNKYKLFELSGKSILPEGTYIDGFDQVISYDYDGTNFIFNTASFRSLKDEKKGVFDVLNRKVLISPGEYESFEPIRYGNFVVRKNNLCGVYNPDGDGKLIIPIQFNHIDSYGQENIIASKGDEFAIYDYEGNEIVPFGCMKVGEYYFGDRKYHFIRRNGKYGVLFVHDNQLVLDVVYDTIYKAGEGINVNGKYGEPFIVKKDGRYGLTAIINEKDRFKEAVFLLPEYDDIMVVPTHSSDHGMNYAYCCCKSGKWELCIFAITISGHHKFKPITDYAFDVKPQEIKVGNDYYWMVMSNGKCGIYSMDEREMVVPCLYDDVSPLAYHFNRYNQKWIVKNDGYYGIVQKAREVQPCEFDKIVYEKGKTRVSKGEKQYYINELGQIEPITMIPENKVSLPKNKGSLPVQNNWMIFVNYGLSNTKQQSWGCTVAFGARVGIYASIMASRLLLFASSNSIILPEQQQNYLWNGESSTSRFSLTAGGTCAIGRMGYVYAGAGYGKRYLVWETMSGQHIAVSPGSFKGMDMEAGLIFNMKYFRISVGGLKQLRNPYYELKFGIGININ